MKYLPEAIRWWKLNDSVAHATGVLERTMFLKPIIWFLQVYDDHWASKFGYRANIPELARRARGDIPRDAPIPLPTTRKRALTNPLPPLESLHSISYSIRRSRQRNDNQTSSLLLTKLPLEIRQTIWELILVDGDRKLVHILRKHGRLGHWRCRIQDSQDGCETQARRCVEGWLAYKAKMSHWDKTGRLDLVTDSDLLPLLRSCRMM